MSRSASTTIIAHAKRLITHHSSLITHHSLLITHTHHSALVTELVYTSRAHVGTAVVQHPDPRERDVRSARAGRSAHVLVRADGLQPPAHRQLPDVSLERSAAALPRVS